MSEQEFWQSIPAINEGLPETTSNRNKLPLFKSITVEPQSDLNSKDLVRLHDMTLHEFVPYIRQLIDGDQFYKASGPSSFKAGATNTQARPLILKVILGLCAEYKQHKKTRHLAILYADLVLTLDPSILTRRFDSDALPEQVDNMKYSLQQSEFLVGCVCVLLASKFYEIDDNLIMISEIQRFHCKFNDLPWSRHDPPLSYDSVVNSELQYLLRLEWNMHRLLPLDVLQAIQYFVGFVLPSDSIQSHNSPSPAANSCSRGMIEDSGRVRRPRKFRSSKLDIQFSPEVGLKTTKNVSLAISVEEMAFQDCDLAIEKNFEFSSFSQLEIAIALVIKARAAFQLSTIPEYTNELEAKLKTKVDQYRVQACCIQVSKLKKKEADQEDFPSVSNHSLLNTAEKKTPPKSASKAVDKSPICTVPEMISQLGWSSKNDHSWGNQQQSASPFQGGRQLSELEPSPYLLHRVHSPLEVRWRDKNRERILKVLQSQEGKPPTEPGITEQSLVKENTSGQQSTIQSLRKKTKPMQPSTQLNLLGSNEYFLQPCLPHSSEEAPKLTGGSATQQGSESYLSHNFLSPLAVLGRDQAGSGSVPSIEPPKDSRSSSGRALQAYECQRQQQKADSRIQGKQAASPHEEPDSSYFLSMGELEVRSIIGKIPRPQDSRTSSEVGSPIANYATVPQKLPSNNFIQSQNIAASKKTTMDSSLQAISSILNHKVSSLAIAASKKGTTSGVTSLTVQNQYLPAGRKTLNSRKEHRVEFEKDSFSVSAQLKQSQFSKSKVRSCSKANFFSTKALTKKNLLFKDSSTVQLKPKVSFQEDDGGLRRAKKVDRGKSNAIQRGRDFFSKMPISEQHSNHSSRGTSAKRKGISRNGLRQTDTYMSSATSITKPQPRKKATTSHIASSIVSAQPKARATAKKAGSLIKIEKKAPALTKAMSRPTLALEMNQSKKKTFLPNSSTKVELISPRLGKSLSRLSPLACYEGPNASGGKMHQLRSHAYKSSNMKTIQEKYQPSMSLKGANSKMHTHTPLESSRQQSKGVRSSSKLSHKKTMAQMYHKVVVSKSKANPEGAGESRSKKDRFVNIFRQNHNSLVVQSKGSPEQSAKDQNQRTQASESPTKMSDSPLQANCQLKKSLGVSPLSEEIEARKRVPSDAISKLTSRISNLKQRKMIMK